ncbi:TetR/AcrR family transcriptional regulator [Bifidobacterium pullorum]|uniref:TetR/AcrR family transcriptional regulator n=1 Tax=Bifidobacterium pullorum TaxID=78448 RepID=UPI00307C573D
MQRNSRYFETAELMDEAFLSLLEEKDPEFITVKDVCMRAGVSRSTFYLHYESFVDLIDESVELMFERFRGEFDRRTQDDVFGRLGSCSTDELYLMVPDLLVPYLEFIRRNRRLFSACVRNAKALGMHEAYGSMERHLIGPILDRFRVPRSERPYLMRFYLNGLMAIVEEWIRRDCGDSVEDIAGIMQRCCVPNGNGMAPSRRAAGSA